MVPCVSMAAMRPRVLLVALLAATTLAGCGVGGSDADAPSPAATPSTSSPAATPSSTPSSPAPTVPTASPTEQAYSTWVRGARPLPVTADGYGEVRPTPPSLRERRYATTDLLPPPSGDRFVSTVASISPAVRARMGETYRPGCPVALADLRYLTVSFRGFDDRAHTGELVVAASVADDLVSVFRSLYRADFPIEEMRLPTTADLDAAPTGDGNNTAAMVCRPTRGQTSGFSAHAYGTAVDVNPFLNPYERGDVVLPELASSYLDRDDRRPGMVEPGGVVTRAFDRIGWGWGGDYRSLKDYQHFSADGS